MFIGGGGDGVGGGGILDCLEGGHSRVPHSPWVKKPGLSVFISGGRGTVSSMGHVHVADPTANTARESVTLATSCTNPPVSN